MPTTDTALYIGCGGCTLNGVPLIPGVTTALIPSGEANGSDLWQPVSPSAVLATALPAGIWDGGSPISDTNPGAYDGGTP